MLEKCPVPFWKNKNVLELAPFNGVIGNFFRSIGSNVISVEGRLENIAKINEEFPELYTIHGNLDTPTWDFDEYGKADIIINYGLFYHLENYHEEHLRNCINHCDLMFFETVVYDSDDSVLYTTSEGTGGDQSLSGVGKTPSTSYVEDILRDIGCKFTKYSDAALNGGCHKYDWVDKNSKIYSNVNRRMWVIEWASQH